MQGETQRDHLLWGGSAPALFAYLLLYPPCGSQFLSLSHVSFPYEYLVGSTVRHTYGGNFSFSVIRMQLLLKDVTGFAQIFLCHEYGLPIPKGVATRRYFPIPL